jgi:hypothetical protein
VGLDDDADIRRCLRLALVEDPADLNELVQRTHMRCQRGQTRQDVELFIYKVLCNSDLRT